MEAGTRTLQNFLQPVSEFVDRPPLVWRRVWLVSWVSAAFWIASSIAIALVSYNQSFLALKELRGPEGALREDCQETTIYPLTVAVPFNADVSLEVTLKGPKYLDKGRLQKLLENMTCTVALPEGGHIRVDMYESDVMYKPTDFRRTCQQPEDDSVLIKAKPDYAKDFSFRFGMIKAIKALERDKLRPPPNVSDFMIFVVTLQTSSVAGSDGLISSVLFRLLFDDGTVLIADVFLHCGEAWPVATSIQRDCTFGTPYERGPQGEALLTSTNPELCPIDMSMMPAAAHAERVLQQLLKHPGMELHLGNWQDGARAEDSVPSMRPLLLQGCSRYAAPGASFFNELERLSGKRLYGSFENIIESVAGNISTDGHYSFLCKQKEWQSYSVWLSIAYPMFALLLQGLVPAVPALYKFSKRLDISRERGDAPMPSGGGGGGGGGVKVDVEDGAPEGVAPMELKELRRLIIALSRRCDGLEAALEARQPHRGSSRGDINDGRAAGTKDIAAEQSRLERDVKNVMGPIVDAMVSRQIEQLCHELLVPITALAAGASTAGAAAVIPPPVESASTLSAAAAVLKEALAAASKEQAAAAAALAATDEALKRLIAELGQVGEETASALAAAKAAAAPLAAAPLAAVAASTPHHPAEAAAAAAAIVAASGPSPVDKASNQEITDIMVGCRHRRHWRRCREDRGGRSSGTPSRGRTRRRGGRNWERRFARCEADIRELHDNISEINIILRHLES